MALIHHPFESIRPFDDSNGRIGRIPERAVSGERGLLDIPVLYLGNHIVRTKAECDRLLQTVREDGAWEAWVHAAA